MFLREIIVAADKRIVERFKGGFVQTFGMEATCIHELYRYLIRRRVRTSSDWKVILIFSDVVSAPPAEALPMRCYWPFNFARYQRADRQVKKRMILDSMQDALLWLADKRGWDRIPLEEAYNEALARDLTLESYLKESWITQDKKYRVRVYFRFDLEAVHLEAVLFRNRSSDELARKELGTGRPYSGCMTDYAADGKWVTATSFQLRSSSFVREVWTVDFSAEMQSD